MLIAGNTGYCNHKMAKLYDITDYYLYPLQFVPLESACTNKIKQWGAPGEKYCRNAPIMKTKMLKRKKLQGIICKPFAKAVI